MNTETLHQQLDAWEEGQLSPSEIHSLQQWITNHPEVVKTIDDRKLVSELMEFAIAQDLRHHFKNTPVQTQSPVFTLKRIAAAAAIGLALLVAGAFLYASQGSFDHSEIAADLMGAAAIPYTGSMRGENPAATGSLHTLILLIEDGQIEKANNLLEDSLAVHPHEPELEYLLGYTAYKSGKYQRSLEIFNDIAFDPPFRYADDLRWNKVLCKIQLDYPVANIQDDLKDIIDDKQSDHREAARSLNDQFNSFGYWLANLL